MEIFLFYFRVYFACANKLIELLTELTKYKQ